MRQALIVWGGWEGHTPERCAAVVHGMLESNGFETKVANTTAAFLDPGLSELSLIVPIITMSEIATEEVKALTSAVRGGVGLAGVHGQMCDSFR